MVQISLQTREERVEMYKKCTKLQLIEMLVECNLNLEALTKQLHKLSVVRPESDVCGVGEQLSNEAEAKGVSDGHDETHTTIRDGEFDWCMYCNKQVKRA